MTPCNDPGYDWPSLLKSGTSHTLTEEGTEVVAAQAYRRLGHNMPVRDRVTIG
jgi:hypothetical protein